jgi:hypothetical protein
MTATGQAFKSPQDASEAGVIDRLTSADELHDIAGRLAVEEKASPRVRPKCISDPESRDAVAEGLSAFHDAGVEGEAAQAIADCVAVGLSDGWDEALASERTHLNRLRATDAGKAAIEAFFAKSSKK